MIPIPNECQSILDEVTFNGVNGISKRRIIMGKMIVNKDGVQIIECDDTFIINHRCKSTIIEKDKFNFWTAVNSCGGQKDIHKRLVEWNIPVDRCWNSCGDYFFIKLHPSETFYRNTILKCLNVHDIITVISRELYCIRLESDEYEV